MSNFVDGSVISFRLQREQKERLDELVESTGFSASYYLRQALDNYLEQVAPPSS
ncbi:ribbon-helix-helix domain-containing protein [Corynebacterium bovis]|uniref:Ribbon-helix-helix protein CopG domain-containing protein n=1 Tax=Corynebacterium bovis TaxID=36808 RepID=A0A426Q4M1_9CORY|nr:hypothetical protein CXF38_00205 [Corynebacterium bovis]RRO90364.1 hypothetical protein CXF45_06050 [Corynebacterium bovis]RRO92775.1 hypothetical protein CXF40_02890 [Corynebacterium bovis]RRO98702.1 hypothetical protein CXF32_00160 [Corynebacterium bovis]RRQ00486.1 hypothetical protein CXF41_06775 [Corynebacterium bovis]